MTRKFFGTDGIRGKTNLEPMTAETAVTFLIIEDGAQQDVRLREPVVAARTRVGDHTLIDEKDVASLKGRILSSGLSVSQLV